MTVATYVQPDNTAQVGAAYKNNIDGATAALRQDSDGFLPHESSPPAMTVTIDAGRLVTPTGDLIEMGQQVTGTIAAPAANPRHDLVVVDNTTAVVEVVTGAEAGAPVDPALPSGKRRIARVRLATSTAAIDNALIDPLKTSGGPGVFTEYFESSLLNWTVDSSVSVSWSSLGFTSRPKICLAVLEFVIAGLGYGVGDEAVIFSGDSGVARYTGLQSWIDGTSVGAGIGTAGINIVSKSGGNTSFYTNDTTVRIRLKAWG